MFKNPELFFLDKNFKQGEIALLKLKFKIVKVFKLKFQKFN